MILAERRNGAERSEAEWSGVPAVRQNQPDGIPGTSAKRDWLCNKRGWRRGKRAQRQRRSKRLIVQSSSVAILGWRWFVARARNVTGGAPYTGFF